MLVHLVAPSGGIESALVDLTRALIAAGHRVSVYACRPFEEPNQNVAELRAAGASVSACPAWLSRVAGSSDAAMSAVVDRVLDLSMPLLVLPAAIDALLRWRSIRRSITGLRGRARVLLLPRLRLERLHYAPLALRLGSFRPQVVHVHGWGCGIDPPGGLAWARNQRLPTVYTEHNSPPENGPPMPSVLHLADGVIACSEAGARGLRATCRAEGMLAVIPYSVADPTVGQLGEPEPVPSRLNGTTPITITCLARLAAEHKGQDVLLRAMARVRESAPGVRLLMAGDGPSREALVDQASALGIADAVEFLGHVPRARLAWLMARSDVMVLPSRWEGLPVSIIESMAFGKPVVASRAGGNPELVADAETGIVVPIGDEMALADALIRLALDEDSRRRMGRAARRRFEAGGFAPSAVARATAAVYEAAIARRRRRECA